MKGVVRDLCYAARQLKAAPGFTISALLVLTLGIGANSATFSILNAVVLRPLPYSDPACLFKITCATPRGPSWFSGLDYTAWHDRTRVFERMAMAIPSRLFLSGINDPEELYGLEVTRDCFPLLGAAPVLGRVFSDKDFDSASPRTIIIGNRLWHRSFGGDNDTIGKPILLNGERYVVIGIMPAEFQFNDKTCEFWLPRQFTTTQLGSPRSRVFVIYARARKGITPAQVQAEVNTVSQMLARQFPDRHKDWWAIAIGLQDSVVAKARPTLFILYGAAFFVLLIACLNFANLLLARGTERAKEIAIRAAMGAGRFRIVRQLLTENLLLVLIGGSFGLLSANWATKGLVFLYLQKTDLPRLEQIGIDGRVLAFTLLLILISSVFGGLFPALKFSRPNPIEILKETGTWRNGGAFSRRVMNLLIVAEVSLSLVLLVGAGLMLRSLYNLQQVKPGFKTDHILTARLLFPQFGATSKKNATAIRWTCAQVA